jgi:hypothetical protein
MLTMGGLEWRKRIGQAAAMAVCATVMIAPWSIRNTLTFDEFVPIRTGSGQLAYAGTVALAETFQPGISESGVPLNIRMKSPGEAVRSTSITSVRRATQDYQLAAVEKAYPSPTGYAELNEAERDSFFIDKTKEFILRHPGIAMEMAYFKLLRFAAIGGKDSLLLVLAAVASAVFLAKSNIQVRALGLLSLSYAAPFSIIVIYFYRYRMPIEPVLVVMACIGMAGLIGWVVPRLRVMSDRTHRQ